MNRLATACLFACLSAPAAAQDNDINDGLSQMRDGARQLLEGLMGEVEPRMQELADALENFDWNGIGLDDLNRYHPPEMLPNGDIILRRKEPLDPEAPAPDGTETET